MKLDDVAKNDDRVAKRYDNWTDLVFDRLLRLERYREQTVRLVGDLDGTTVLDIGCGTGRNFPLLAPQVGPGGRIIGIDYSQGMLEQATARIQQEGWTNISLVRGDAVSLDGIPEPVDAVVSVRCLGIVHDLQAALSRAITLLRPRGRIAIMDFGRASPDHGVLRWLYPLYSAVPQRAGIDSAEDLDDARLRANWERGRAILRVRLEDVHEESYLSGVGMIISGANPEGTRAS